MDTIRHRPTEVEDAAGTVELVEGGEASVRSPRPAALHGRGQATPDWDKTHLGEAGHKLAAETVAAAIAGGKSFWNLCNVFSSNVLRRRPAPLSPTPKVNRNSL